VIAVTDRSVLLCGTVVVCGAVSLLLPLGRGEATVIAVRTQLVSRAADGGPADGASANPAMTPDGRIVVFDTAATNLVAGEASGAGRQVAAVDLRSGERWLVSAGANGPSWSPTISADGRRVAFVSEASNLVPGDTNGFADVFVRDRDGSVQRVSVAPGHRPANGPSSDPHISADGRYVVFTSAASNLVPGDHNRQPDVFLRDLKAQRTIRVSVTSSGAQANGPSGSPAISADGRVVSFASKATNLVGAAANAVPQVFVRDLPKRRTERISVSTSGRQQNKAVIAPFSQISALSADGRYVVFDSDATNLVPHDTNRRTDIFRHDRLTGRTTLISVSSTGYEGNNDSFAPSISANGRFVIFESFASNLARGRGPRENIFVRDLALGTTSVVNVPAGGGRRAPELVKQLLQRAAISNDGRVAAFTSTAANLTPDPTNGVANLYIRRLTPPHGRLVGHPRPAPRPVIALSADDPLATTFICRLDHHDPFPCPRGSFRLPAGLTQGRHVLRVRAGGPGMLFDPQALTARVTVARHGAHQAH